MALIAPRRRLEAVLVLVLVGCAGADARRARVLDGIERGDGPVRGLDVCNAACGSSGPPVAARVIEVAGLGCWPDLMVTVGDGQGLEALCGPGAARVAPLVDFARERLLVASPRLVLRALPGELAVETPSDCGDGGEPPPDRAGYREIRELLVVPRSAGAPCAMVCGDCGGGPAP